MAPAKKKEGTTGETAERMRKRRVMADKNLSGSPGTHPDLKGRTPEQLIHELEVHQIELETQGEELRRIQHELEKSRYQYIDLYEFAPVGYLSLNEKGLITMANLTAATLLGVERNKLINYGFSGLIAPEHQATWRQYFLYPCRKGEKQAISLIMVRGDGTTFPARLDGTCITTGDGPVVIRLTISDISDIVKSQQALSESMDRFRMVFESSMDGIFLSEPDGRVIAANPAACRILGWTEEELCRIGRQGVIDHTDPRLPLALAERAEKGGYCGELTFIRRDGSRFPAELSSTIYQDAAGNRHTSIIFRDITERVQAQESFRTSLTRLESAMEMGNLAWWEMDCSTGNVVFSERKAKMLGYPGEQFSYYADFTKLLHPDDYEHTMQAMQDHLSGLKKNYEVDYRIRTRDGEYRWFHDTGGISAYGPRGVPVRVTGFVIDITERKRTEEALKESEERLRLAQVSANIGIWDWVIPTGELLWSPELEALYGLRPGTIKTYDDWRKLVHPDDIDPLEQERDLAITKHRHFSLEFRILHSSGDVRWIASQGKAFYDQAGNVYRVLGVNIDITNSKRIEVELTDAIEWLKIVQASAKSGFWDWDFPSGKLTWSDEFLELFGLPDTVEPSFETWLSVLHPDDRAPALATIDQSVRDHTDLWNEYRVILPGGDVCWIGASGKTTYNESGEPLRMSGICLDITERKRMEKALVESEGRYRGLINGVPDYILVHRDGTILFVNPAAIEVMGYPEDDIVGSSIMEYVAPESRAQVTAMVSKRSKGVCIPPYEITIMTKGGERRVTEVHGSLIMYRGELASLNVLSDITGRKRAEEAREHLLTDLTQKNAELERFTYTVSHDLKSPLITIRGFLGYLEKDVLAGDPGRVHDDIMRIHTATDKMEDFIAALLELSRIGRIVRPPVRRPLALFVQEAIEALYTQIQERGVAIIVPQDLPEVYGDQVRLQQVMTNLIGNAIKFMGDQEEPRIEIRANQKGEMTTVCVGDNGIGISPDNLDNVFLIFTRLNPEIPGTGIGLALVKRIIELHHGTVWVESPGLGLGSTFCFSLPDARGDERSANLEK